MKHLNMNIGNLSRKLFTYILFPTLFPQRVLHIQYHMFVPSHLYTLLLALYLPVIALGVLFNLTIITTIMTTAKLRTDPRNSFIVALAFSDLFLCIFTSPLTLWYTLEGHWPLGGNTELLCKYAWHSRTFNSKLIAVILMPGS